jgi:cyanophycinase-like exopeptidase
VAAGQPEALSVAALVFAGIALVGTNASLAVMSDLLLVALSCFVIVWAASHWFMDFTVQLAGDAFRWTGLATFLAAVYEFSLHVAPGSVGRWAVLLAMVALALLSVRAASAHWHNAVALADKPLVTDDAETAP